jgi:hypothetical protein
MIRFDVGSLKTSSPGTILKIMVGCNPRGRRKVLCSIVV